MTIEWGNHHGYRTAAIQHSPDSHWCGYVAVPPGHPAHGADYDRAPIEEIEVHGGLTFAGPNRRLGRPKDWWLGFDAAHYGDFGGDVITGRPNKGLDFIWPEVDRLAKQLKDLEVPA